jgi:outer membrane lipoprotein-sorting protein
MFRRITLGLLIGLIFAGLLFSQANDTPSGREVMENVYYRPTGDEMTADLKMVLTNSRGATRERSIKQFSKSTDDVDKKMMFFLDPADVRDSSFMNWSYHDGRSDDQWIYLPAIRKIRRISADSKNDSFMGSDFTYDDLGERHPDEDKHKIIGEEEYNGEPCYIVESVPVGSGDTFSKTVSWIIKDKWIGLKREYYDENGQVYKILQIDDYEKIDNYWVITDMIIRDLGRNHSTRIRMENVRFNIGLRDNQFSERQMMQGPRL